MILLVSFLCSPLASFAQSALTPITITTSVFEPTFVAIDGTTLYVSNHGDPQIGGTSTTAPANGGQILKFNLANLAAGPTAIAFRGTADGQFISPDQIVVDPTTHNLFIADRYLNRVQEITSTGSFVMKWGSTTAGAADEMHGPVSLARDPTSGDIFVGEHGDTDSVSTPPPMYVSRYHLNGTSAPTKLWRNPMPENSSVPYGLAVDSGRSRLYVSDGFNSKILSWDLNGNSAGSALTSAWIPTGLTMVGTNLWAGQTDNGGVQGVTEFNPGTGATVMTLGFNGQGSANNQFDLPFDVAVDTANNRAYVADYNNKRIAVWDITTVTDTTPPTVASFSANTGSATSTSVNFNLTFSESVTGVTAADFTATGAGGASGATVGSVSGSGASYTIPVTFTGTSGTVTLALNATANSNIKDLANNAYAGGGTGGSNQATFTIQSTTVTPPSLPAGPAISSFALNTSSVVQAAGTLASHATAVVTFDTAVTGVDATDFTVNGPGQISSVSGSGTTYNVNFNYTNDNTSHLQIAIKTSATGIVDGSSNAFYGKGVTATVNYPIGPTTTLNPPSVSSFTAGTPGASSVNFTLTFDEAVTGITSGSFVVGKSGTIAATVGTPTSSGGTTWTVPVTFSGTGGLELLVVGGATTNIKAADGTLYDGGGSSTSAAATIGGGGGTTAPGISVTGTAAFGSVTVGNNSTQTFTITNTGNATLTLGAVSVTGTNASSFTVTQPASTSLAAGATTTFTATFTPTAAQSYSATINVANNSATNPATVAVTGTGATAGTTAPGISVTGTAGFGTVTVGSNSTQTFTITNTGNATLTLGTVSVTGTNASSFTVTQPASASVAAGGSTTFTVKFTPAAAQSYSATVNVANNSATNPATVAVTGTGATAGTSAPGISVTGTGAFGTVNVGSNSTHTFTITNTGNATLTLGSVSLTGTNASSFTVTQPASSTVAAGATTTFTATFAPTAAQAYSATINVANNSATNPATVAVTGTGAAVNVAGAPVVSNATVTGTVGASINSIQVQATNSPTSFSAPNLPIYGLTISNTGVITGVPTIAVTGATVSVTAANSFGTSQPATITLNIAASPTNTGGGGGGGGGGFTGGGGGGGGFSGGGTRASQTIVFLPSTNVSVGDTITLSASSSANLPVTFVLVSGNATLNNNVLTVTGTGAIVVRAYNNGDANTLGASADATITAKTKQTVSFVSPTSGIIIGTPIQLSATSSAGLPITFSVVSGSGSISGNTLTPTGPGALVVRATSVGNSTVAAASTDVNFGSPQKAAQAITFATMPDVTVTSGPIKLAATTSSGLALKYSVSGPATLNGDTLTLTGAAGTVTITAVQSGDDSFNPAASVTRTFQVRALNEQVYFGTDGADAFAVAIAQDNSRGTFLMRVSSTGEAIVITFKINADGTFTATSTSSTGQTHTLLGSIANTTFAATLDNTNIGANLQSPSGASASYAGLYMATIPGSSSGTTYLVVSPSGQTYALSVSNSGTAAGTGTLSSTGSVNITAGSGTSIAATLDGQTGAMKGTVTAAGVTSSVAGLNDGVTHTDRLVNVSSRLRLTGGDSTRAVIAGFVVTGTENKQILIRAIGPGLAAFGVSDALSTPALSLYDSTGKLVAKNDGWNNDASIVTANQQVGAFKLTAGSHDSALLLSLAPGAYTAQVTSANNGIVLIEVYDATTATAVPTKQLINISTRGFVGTGDDSLVAGFAVTGNAPKRVLIRGVGPALTAFGVSGALADPQLKLYASGSSTALAQNDDWGTPQPIGTQTMATAAEVTAADTAAGAFPLAAGSKDAVIVITLNPGSYSAVMSGAGGTTGAGLIEVYEIPNP